MLEDTEVADLLAKGLNQSEIALITGYSVSTISRLRSKLRRKYFQEHPKYASLRKSNAFDAFPKAIQSQWNRMKLDATSKVFVLQRTWAIQPSHLSRKMQRSYYQYLQEATNFC